MNSKETNEMIYYVMLGLVSQESPERQQKIKDYQARIDQLIADNPDDSDLIRFAIMLYTLKEIVRMENE